MLMHVWLSSQAVSGHELFATQTALAPQNSLPAQSPSTLQLGTTGPSQLQAESNQPPRAKARRARVDMGRSLARSAAAWRRALARAAN